MSPVISTLVACLFGAFSGWAPTGLNVWHQARRSRRAAIGHILSVLLEIRHRTRIWEGVSRLFRGIQDDMPQELGFSAFRERLETTTMPSIASLTKDYEAFINLIAREDPILACRMRHLHLVFDSIQNIPEQFSDFVKTDQDLTALRDVLSSTHTKVFELLQDAIEQLAWQHGVKTWIKVKKALRDEPDVLDIFDEIVDTLPEPARSIIRAAVQRARSH